MRLHLKLIFALFALLMISCNKDKSAETPVRVISFNVRTSNANDGDNSWANRCKAIKPMLQDADPTVFGLQEARKDQVDYIHGQLRNEYSWYGVARDDGDEKGEYTAIFWKKDVLTLDEHGTLWLSETPDVPSIGWDAAYKRTATWAFFTVRSTGRRFMYLNTHLDHQGRTARFESMKLIKSKVKELNVSDLPVIITGDFNADPSSEPGVFAYFNGWASNARSTAPGADRRNTFNAFGSSAGKMLDHIYYRNFVPQQYKTISASYAGVPYISDHYPILGVFSFE